MPTSDNPIVTLILGLVFVLIGSGGGGYIVALRKDKRRGRNDDVKIMDEVRRIAREELRTQRRRTDRLELRVEQLTEILRARGIPVPPWPPVAPDSDGG